MFTPFEFEALAIENQKNLERAIKRSVDVLEAKRARVSSPRHGSKMLVKLASLLIQSGEYLMSRAQQDLKSTFPGASLQNM